MEVTACAQCGAALIGPEANSIPFEDKLLTALGHPVPEIRARAATILGVIGNGQDLRITRALIATVKEEGLTGALRDVGVSEAAMRSLANLGACEASASLSMLAMNEKAPLAASLSAVDALVSLARAGCYEAYHGIEHLASEGSRTAVQLEASSALAALNEPE